MEHPELPPWLDAANRLVELIELTGWTPDELDRQPAWLIDQILTAGRVRRDAALRLQATSIARALGGQ